MWLGNKRSLIQQKLNSDACLKDHSQSITLTHAWVVICIIIKIIGYLGETQMLRNFCHTILICTYNLHCFLRLFVCVTTSVNCEYTSWPYSKQHTLYGVQPSNYCDVAILLPTFSWSQFILQKLSVFIQQAITANIHHLRHPEKLHLQPVLLQQTSVLFDMQDEDQFHFSIRKVATCLYYQNYIMNKFLIK